MRYYYLYIILIINIIQAIQSMFLLIHSNNKSSIYKLTPG